MDHHCPWIHNCVGYYNHRYFVLFLAYMWIGCGYIALMSAQPFFSEDVWRKPWHYPLGRGSVVFVFVLTISICLSMTFMMAWQMFLVLTAQTTIEFYFNRFRKRDAYDAGENWRNEYDLGVVRNAMEFFGITHWWQLLFPLTNLLPGDGLPAAAQCAV
jgi:palmitoyltransferase